MVRNHDARRHVLPDMSTVRHLILTAATLLALALATACGEAAPVTGEPPEELDGDWRLVEGHGPDGQIPIVEGHDITLSIEDGDWGGTAACNSYSATVETDSGSLRVTELLQTEMACPGTGVMESEQAYLAAFDRVSGFTVTEDELTLHGTDVGLGFQRRS